MYNRGGNRGLYSRGQQKGVRRGVSMVYIMRIIYYAG